MNGIRTTYEKFKQYQYYIIIGMISLIAVFFLPMLGSVAGLEWVLPTTVAGWIVYIVSKLIIAIINILIFHCFILQGKTNILNHPKYLEAIKMLNETNHKDGMAPRSPRRYFNEVYGKKGVSIFFTSVLSVIGLTQAILTFDLVTMLTYLFTIIMGVIFGILQMNEVEAYWTTEYWQYAKEINKIAMEAKTNDRNQWQNTSESGRTGTEE